MAKFGEIKTSLHYIGSTGKADFTRSLGFYSHLKLILLCNDETIGSVLVFVMLSRTVFSPSQSIQYESYGSWLYNEFCTWARASVKTDHSRCIQNSISIVTPTFLCIFSSSPWYLYRSETVAEEVSYLWNLAIYYFFINQRWRSVKEPKKKNQ